MVKAEVGQTLYNDKGETLGVVVRRDGDTVFHVPEMTPIGFGKAEYYCDWKGERLS